MLAQVLLSSITAGAVYALIALGFVLIHKGTGVVHFGYGDQVTFGAYLVLIGQAFVGLRFDVAVVIALLGSVALGAAIYFALMWPLRNASLLARIIASLALGTALREFLRSYMGPSAWPFPFLLSSTAVDVGGLLVVPANLAIIGVAIAVLVVLFILFDRTPYGKAILAACENSVGASLVGIHVSTVFMMIWIVASVLATIAGILVAPLLTLSPDMGLIGIKGFTAAVLGGFNSLPGAVAGGLALGILEALVGTYISSALKDMISYAILIGVILVRPQGLFGELTLKKV
ncbi:high-affinity branched-chain amino acid transport system permease protein LivH [Variibacter gotjawalensis]|uniref:High-affinity branched-chain amino acid transport system permease protein LivH n=1 Tax=Variibacter gotjawalensis TaxID=1333996 RepID=A0A0S3PU66_9BRAD|nr:branched-chain amino acid ABC transporter permease [Variibacter gotjawalensis]NIK49773.1 branched-chain amino acid transport system permease protein [Variibacter gotjawalensis]RZS45778.1 amino acid/amide ABC transporter membrane protein 1 (HAAT family) [Variibacter gotjawalensis]BAT59451.1 high-affinity branched-chain amino acid transport system permease protein LivH [Variibacter gotjawalensis]